MTNLLRKKERKKNSRHMFRTPKKKKKTEYNIFLTIGSLDIFDHRIRYSIQTHLEKQN